MASGFMNTPASTCPESKVSVSPSSHASNLKSRLYRFIWPLILSGPDSRATSAAHLFFFPGQDTSSGTSKLSVGTQQRWPRNHRFKASFFFIFLKSGVLAKFMLRDLFSFRRWEQQVVLFQNVKRFIGC